MDEPDNYRLHGHPVTGYFRNNVLPKRNYLHIEWCLSAIENPLHREVQENDGRIRHWIWVEDIQRYLRVVTLEDGVTIHNAFPDRRFEP